MKVLLVQPPVEDFYDTDVRLQPIGLAYLKAAALKRFPELNIRIVDFHHGWGRRTKRWPKDLAYLRPYYEVDDRGPFSSFHRYFRFGAEDEEIRRVFETERPDVVGVSSLFTPYYREALRVAELAKAAGATVVLGGSHVSADPEGMLKPEFADYVIRGEGEKPFVDFLECRMTGNDPTGIAGLGYKHGGQLILNPIVENGEFPPIPDLDDFSPDNYRIGRKPLTFMITSRSCPHRCSFCSVHTTFGTRYRRRAIEDILAEIRLRAAQGYRVIDFEDDNLTFFKSGMKELCRRLIAEFRGRGLEFVAMNGISYLSLDEELLLLMRQAGFSRLNLALVSSDVSVLETSRRPHTIEKYTQVVESAHRLGFHITSYQILGLPYESLDSMIRTMSLAAQRPVLLGASMFYRTPASPIAATCVSTGDDPHFLARLTAMAVETENFQRGDLYTLFLTTRILNFFKSLPDSPHSRIGLEILERLDREGVLYAATPAGFKPLPEFRFELFNQVRRQTGFVSSLIGQKVALASKPAAVVKESLWT